MTPVIPVQTLTTATTTTNIQNFIFSPIESTISDQVSIIGSQVLITFLLTGQAANKDFRVPGTWSIIS